MKTQKLKIKVWKAKDGYRWNMKRCGRIVAESGEGYKRIHSCTTALSNLIRSINKLDYVWVDLNKLGFPNTGDASE